MAEEAVSVFLSYSSQDREMLDQLNTHLAGLVKTGKITIWCDRDIEAGSEWEPAILERLKTAEIIILLISADFIKSEYCYGKELKLAIERHDARKAQVIPVILKDCLWNLPEIPFSKLNALPKDGKPIAMWQHPEEAFRIVAEQISKSADAIRKNKADRVAKEQSSPETAPIPSSFPEINEIPTLPPKNSTPQRQNLVSRRSFLVFMGLGGLASAITLNQLIRKPTVNRPAENPTKSPSATDVLAGNGVTPKLTRIQFTSVKLNDRGEIIDRPKGYADIFTEELGGGVSLTMVRIPAGSFKMGQTPEERRKLLQVYKAEDYQQFFGDELPLHQVKVPEFYIGQTLVTQAQWQAVMNKNPSKFQGDGKLPVDSVSWLDAMDFCLKLTQFSGRSYRLPTEAEWEYACRAGTETAFAFGETIIPAVVNYNGNYPYGGAAKGEYRQKTTIVGSLPPNEFGLYDMHGNLWEWCLDEYVDNYKQAPVDATARGDINSRADNKNRLLRGGCWYNDAFYCRSADRNHNAAGYRNQYCGLRLVSGPSRTS